MSDLKICFLVFITYSFIGWIVEIISVGITNKKIVNRGFLIGPYCPIYGVGAVLMILFIDTSKNDLFGIFVKTMVICAILEYLTSYIMEKLFKTRWWDYSNNKFNINGRICLETMILFGIGGCAILYIVSPAMITIYELTPPLLLTIISGILFIVFVTDIIISFNVINSFKNTITNISKDSTEEISRMVKAKLQNKAYLKIRLINAFPNMNKLKKK